MSSPLAFLLTFHTYGTWLHGDERGSVDRDHNVWGTPQLPERSARVGFERSLARHAPLVFDNARRAAVDGAIAAECAFRRWELLERAVRTNHVHVVVAFADVGPEKMVRCLKSHATRVLRQRGLVAADRPVWTDRAGSRRYLWKPEHVNAAVAYVREGQDVPR